MSRKLTVTLIFLLFLLPFVSWYYLQSGLDWRKKAQDILSGTQVFPAMDFISPTGIAMEQSQLDYHVSLVTLMACDSFSSQIEMITRLYGQFKSTHKANFLFIDTCSGSNYVLPDSLTQGIFKITCLDSLNNCSDLIRNWPVGKAYALLDKHRIIRAYYPAHTHDEKKLLVEHMALLLPRELGEKVEIKRNSEKK